MNTFRSALVAVASVIALIGAAQAQSSSSSSATNAANSTGTSTSQQEMNRGVPGVDVDAGKNANGAVDVTTDKNTDSRNITGNDNATSTSGTSTSSGRRAARADRG